MTGSTGLEPATCGFGDRCSAKLSYDPSPVRELRTDTTISPQPPGTRWIILSACSNVKEECLVAAGDPAVVPGDRGPNRSTTQSAQEDLVAAGHSAGDFNPSDLRPSPGSHLSLLRRTSGLTRASSAAAGPGFVPACRGSAGGAGRSRRSRRANSTRPSGGPPGSWPGRATGRA